MGVGGRWRRSGGGGGWSSSEEWGGRSGLRPAIEGTGRRRNRRRCSSVSAHSFSRVRLLHRINAQFICHGDGTQCQSRLVVFVLPPPPSAIVEEFIFVASTAAAIGRQHEFDFVSRLQFRQGTCRGLAVGCAIRVARQAAALSMLSIA